MNKVKIEIHVSQLVVEEINYLVKLINQHGASGYIGLSETSLDGLIEYILVHIADGSRRPGAWERQLLEMLGIVPECQELQDYREIYGDPTTKELTAKEKARERARQNLQRAKDRDARERGNDLGR